MGSAFHLLYPIYSRPLTTIVTILWETFTFVIVPLFLSPCDDSQTGAPVAQWIKRWPTDLAGRVRSSLSRGNT